MVVQLAIERLVVKAERVCRVLVLALSAQLLVNLFPHLDHLGEILIVRYARFL